MPFLLRGLSPPHFGKLLADVDPSKTAEDPAAAVRVVDRVADAKQFENQEEAVNYFATCGLPEELPFVFQLEPLEMAIDGERQADAAATPMPPMTDEEQEQMRGHLRKAMDADNANGIGTINPSLLPIVQTFRDAQVEFMLGLYREIQRSAAAPGELRTMSPCINAVIFVLAGLIRSLVVNTDGEWNEAMANKMLWSIQQTLIASAPLIGPQAMVWPDRVVPVGPGAPAGSKPN